MGIIRTFLLISSTKMDDSSTIFLYWLTFLVIGLKLLEDLGQNNMSSTISDIDEKELPIYNVHNDPVMIEAINVLSLLGSANKAILRAKGNSIPNAVAIANIITEKMLKGNSKVENIIVDTEMPAGIGKMLSTIEIVLLKN